MLSRSRLFLLPIKYKISHRTNSRSAQKYFSENLIENGNNIRDT